MGCKAISQRENTPIHIKAKNFDVLFRLPAREKYTWTTHDEIVAKSNGKPVNIITINASNAYCTGILASLDIFRLGRMDEPDIAAWYRVLEEKCKKNIVENGHEFGPKSRRDSKNQWIYAESIKGKRIVARQYGALVGEFAILIAACAELPISSVVNSLVIDHEYKCKPFKI